jgi:uncharacterized protein YgbK (DUF1537 family)
LEGPVRQPNSNRLLICFYGDDFTGSTDALESLTQAGVRTALFTSPPKQDQLAEYPGLEAIGVAGMTRSLRVDAINKELKPALSALKVLRPRHVHYKVCSTFDSSPTIGSIGAVIDLAWNLFRPRFVPVVVGAPALGRHCVFGNLFARAGTGSEPVRLDRHPTMSTHPVTSMHESDLRLHLARQTKKRIALFDILKLELPRHASHESLDNLLESKPDVVLFDVIYERQLVRIGELIDSFPSAAFPLFSVGSSGLGMALAKNWQAKGLLSQPRRWPTPGAAPPLLAVSGSCSPVTARQIKWAIRNGFEDVPLDTAALANPRTSASAEQKTTEEIVRHLGRGHSVVAHTCRGPGDPRMAARKTLPVRTDTEGHLGVALGRIIRETLASVKLRRVCLAGGDTSSYAARVLGIQSMEMIARLAPGAPLCRVRAPGSAADGLEMNFKGGQVGSDEYFGKVLEGRSDDWTL